MERRMRIPTVKTFRQLEEVVNKALGLRRTKGSGSVAGDGDGKGWIKDVDTYHLILGECKYTEKERGSVSIKKKDFIKTEQAALRLGRIASMFYSDADGEPYAIMKLSDFADIYMNHINYIKENRNE